MDLSNYGGLPMMRTHDGKDLRVGDKICFRLGKDAGVGVTFTQGIIRKVSGLLVLIQADVDKESNSFDWYKYMELGEVYRIDK